MTLPATTGGQQLARKSSLHVVQSPVGRFQRQVEEFAKHEGELISSLPTMEEDDVVKLRLNSKRLSVHAWVLEIACDADLWNRAQAKRGRGNVDVEGVGINAAVAKRAKELGLTPKTLRTNARLFRLFGENVNRTVHILPEKEFYKVAAKTSDPQETLQTFITEKESNPKFNPAGASRLLTSKKKDTTANKAAIVEKFTQPEEKSLSQHTREFLVVVRQYRESCPSEDFKKRMYDPILEDFEEFLEGDLADSATKSAITDAWLNRCTTEEQIVNRTKLPHPEVKRLLGVMERDGEFIKIVRGSETIWWKAGVPLTSAVSQLSPTNQ